MNNRNASIRRQTKETTIDLSLEIDGSGSSSISTGLGFFDHMLTALALHARFNLTLTCHGDQEVDDHHSIEDCGLALGSAIDQALGDRTGIQRFGSAYAPLDEALARAVIDISGRAGAYLNIPFRRQNIGAVATENLSHFFQSLTATSRTTLHIDVLRGENDHHIAESVFKACALALREACRINCSSVPSTKGTLV